MIGQTIAHYRITAKLGAGGMGEVYRAVDTKLDREVALKILPPAFASDSGRMARFEREAKVLASLNHPNIAAIYGVEERALVMELVEGTSPKGPMPFDDAWKIASQIAAALEYAHDKGIVHRDLKPDNIKITPDGVVKLLDFGLAKAFTEQKELSANPEHSPTLTIGATEVGVILGTAAYMSPEQAKGKSVDKRADIWAFGVVLYELLTGEQLFQSEDTADTLARVLTKQPDLQRAPAPVRMLLRRCLEKDPKERLRDLGEARFFLYSQTENAPTARRSGGLPWIVATGITTLIAVATSWIAWHTTRPEERPLTRLTVDLGPDAMKGLSTTVAISPDGRRLVYPARGPDGKQQLATRLFDQAQPILLPGTEGGFDAFFSPDGKWIGFFAEGQLKKISVDGGAPVALCAAPAPQGGAWSERGDIIVALNAFGPLSKVSANGGIPEEITKRRLSEQTHRWPQVLPGGAAVLFTASSSVPPDEDADVKVASLKTGESKILQHGGYYGRYLPSGHLVYVHEGVMYAVPFDPTRWEVRGTPTPLVQDLAANPTTGGGQFDFSGVASVSGTLIYLTGKSSGQMWQLSWLDRFGNLQPLLAKPGTYRILRFSPDGTKLAFVNGGDIYVHDLERGISSRLLFKSAASMPTWAPDGRHIVFRSFGLGLFWTRSDGAGEPEPLLRGENNWAPFSISPDGRRLAYEEQARETGFDLWTLPLDTTDPDHPKPGKPEPLLHTAADERFAMISPDGRWIAYGSNESGARETYVRPFPAVSQGKWQISVGGSVAHLWSRNALELFYVTPDYHIMAVDYTVNGSSFVPRKPRLWSDRQIIFPSVPSWDIHPDGRRFAVVTEPKNTGGDKDTFRVVVLQNFFDEVKRRIPTGRK